MTKHHVSPKNIVPQTHNELDEKQLFRHYAPNLYRYILARMPDSDIAHEILHDVFLHTIETSRCQTLRFPKAFMYTLAKRNIANFYRRQTIESNYQHLLAEHESGWHLETQLLIEEQLALVSEQLATLPKQVSDTYLLAKLDGMTYQQIALQLKVSPNSIKYYLQMARKVLQNTLSEINSTH